MSSLAIELAQTITTELETHTFSEAVIVRRLYRPRDNPEELENLTLTVVPRSVEWSALSRDIQSRHANVIIDVAVQKKVSATFGTELDDLMALVEEVALFIAGLENIGWMSTRNEPIYSVRHLEEFQVFTSTLSVTCKGVADV